MKKVIWKTLRVVMPVGETYAEGDISLERGERILAAAVASKSPGQLVSLGLYENSMEVSAPMDLQFWERSNAGKFLDGFKPLDYSGGGTVQAKLNAKTAIAAEDLQVEMVFAIIQESTSC